jgi:uncharacterized protein
MSDLVQYWDLFLAFFVIALLYASVGFGGGSSYLAILALFGLNFNFLKAAALICNITVVSNGTFQFYRKNLLNFKKMLPLVLSSVPMAFLGGKMLLKEQTFFIILGITLAIAAILLWFQPQQKSKSTFQDKIWLNVIIGASIGFLSGLVGIGGGIFLSPLLFFINWDEPKKIAATASFFILVNSIAGLLGQFSGPKIDVDWLFIAFLVLSVALGGAIGTFILTNKFSSKMVQKATAILIGYVSYTVLKKYI